MKYKVGDKVRVKNGLKGDNYYGYTRFDCDMEKYCGKLLTIRELSPYGESYRVLENHWWWTDKMFDKPEKFINEVMFK